MSKKYSIKENLLNEEAAASALATDANTMKGATGEFFTAFFLVNRNAAPGIKVRQSGTIITYPRAITQQWKTYGTNPKNGYSCLDRATSGKTNFKEFNNSKTQQEAKEIADMIFQHRGSTPISMSDVQDAAVSVGAGSAGGQGDIIVKYSRHPDSKFSNKSVPWSLKVGSSKPGLQNQGAGYLEEASIGVPIRETVLSALAQHLGLSNPVWAPEVAFDDDYAIRLRVATGALANSLQADECLVKTPGWKSGDPVENAKTKVKIEEKGSSRIFSTPAGWIGMTYQDGIAKLRDGKIVLISKDLYGEKGTEDYFTTVVGKKLGTAMATAINTKEKFSVILEKVIRIADIGDSNSVPVLVGSPGAAKKYREAIDPAEGNQEKTSIEAVIQTQQLFPHILKLSDPRSPLLRKIKVKSSGNSLFFGCDAPSSEGGFLPLFETSLRKSKRSGSVFSLKFDVKSVTYPSVSGHFSSQSGFFPLGDPRVLGENKMNSLKVLLEDLEIPEALDGEESAFEDPQFVQSVEDEIIDSEESPLNSPTEAPRLELDVSDQGPVYPHPDASEETEGPIEQEQIQERWLKLAGILLD